MQPLASHNSEQPTIATAIVPEPRCALRVRPAGTDDLPFLDHLQKMHTHMVGFFPRKQMEGYLAMGAILVAEDEKKTQLATAFRATPTAGAMMWGSSTSSTLCP